MSRKKHASPARNTEAVEIAEPVLKAVPKVSNDLRERCQRLCAALKQKYQHEKNATPHRLEEAAGYAYEVWYKAALVNLATGQRQLGDGFSESAVEKYFRRKLNESKGR